MTTVVLKIPDKKETLFLSFLKKHRLKMRVIEKEEDEGVMAKWIDKGMKSEDASEEEIFAILPTEQLF